MVYLRTIWLCLPCRGLVGHALEGPLLEPHQLRSPLAAPWPCCPRSAPGFFVVSLAMILNRPYRPHFAPILVVISSPLTSLWPRRSCFTPCLAVVMSSVLRLHPGRGLLDLDPDVIAMLWALLAVHCHGPCCGLVIPGLRRPRSLMGLAVALSTMLHLDLHHGFLPHAPSTLDSTWSTSPCQQHPLVKNICF